MEQFINGELSLHVDSTLWHGGSHPWHHSPGPVAASSHLQHPIHPLHLLASRMISWLSHLKKEGVLFKLGSSARIGNTYLKLETTNQTWSDLQRVRLHIKKHQKNNAELKFAAPAYQELRRLPYFNHFQPVNMEHINMHIIISHFGVRLEYLKMRAPPRNLDKSERNLHLCLLGFFDLLLSLISSEYIQYPGPPVCRPYSGRGGTKIPGSDGHMFFWWPQMIVS